MKSKKNLLILSSVILTSVVLFSGCTDPAQKNAQQINLTDTTINGEATNQNGNTKQATQVEQTNTKDSTNLERPPQMPEYKELKDFKEIAATQAVFETTKGTLVMDLYREKAPLTTANFLNLIDEGFYDGIVFHRVIPDFMAQVGDPLTKDPAKEAMWGTGGPDYRIMDEFDPTLKHDSAGILSMANSGPNTGGSQIFITYVPTPHLDGKHAVFGKLVEGMDILESITVGDKITKASYR